MVTVNILKLSYKLIVDDNMSRFEFIEMTEVKGKTKIYKLKVDSICQYDEFYEKNKDKKYMRIELNRAAHRIEKLINGHMMPINHYRILKYDDLRSITSEIKTNNLRVYIFELSGLNRTIAFVGLKSKQKKDLARFHNLVKEIEKEYSE